MKKIKLEDLKAGDVFVFGFFTLNSNDFLTFRSLELYLGFNEIFTLDSRYESEIGEFGCLDGSLIHDCFLIN